MVDTAETRECHLPCRVLRMETSVFDTCANKVYNHAPRHTHTSKIWADHALSLDGDSITHGLCSARLRPEEHAHARAFQKHDRRRGLSSATVRAARTPSRANFFWSAYARHTEMEKRPPPVDIRRKRHCECLMCRQASSQARAYARAVAGKFAMWRSCHERGQGKGCQPRPRETAANAKEVFCATCESLVSMGFGHLSRIVAVGSLAKGVRERNC